MPGVFYKPHCGSIQSTNECIVFKPIKSEKQNKPENNLKQHNRKFHICLSAKATYDLDVRAGSNACGNVGGDTLPLPVILLCQGLEL